MDGIGAKWADADAAVAYMRNFEYDINSDLIKCKHCHKTHFSSAKIEHQLWCPIWVLNELCSVRATKEGTQSMDGMTRADELEEKSCPDTAPKSTKQ